MDRQFQVGDKVRALEDNNFRKKGDIGVVIGHVRGDPRVNWAGHNDWITDRNTIELIPPEPQIPVIYKQVAIRDGKYWSSFVGVKGHDYSASRISGMEGDCPALEYPIGQIVTAPTERGIFCSKNKENALADAKTRLNVTKGLSALLACYPIGEEIETVMFTGHWCNYPAVYVIHEIWREEEKPKEEWVDVTGECTTSLLAASCGGAVGSRVHLFYRNETVGNIGLGEPTIEEGYKIEKGTENYIEKLTTFKIFKRVTK